MLFPFDGNCLSKDNRDCLIMSKKKAQDGTLPFLLVALISFLFKMEAFVFFTFLEICQTKEFMMLKNSPMTTY